MSAQNRSQTTSRVIIVIASILVISSLGFFAFNYFSQQEKIRKTDQERSQLEIEILGLEKQILDFRLERDSQESALLEKDRELTRVRDELERLQTQLGVVEKKAEDSDEKLVIMSKRLSNMQKMVRQYEEQIEQLRAENQALGERLDSAIVDLEVAGQENTELKQENRETRDELDRTKKLGSILKANNLKYFRLNEKGKPKDKEDDVFRRFNMKGIRVCFDILDNPIAASGQREIYLVLENPDGSINTNSEDGYSGIFTYEGKRRKYSAQYVLNYRKTSVEVCIDYIPEKDFKYQKGPQFVRIYSSDGDLIGQGQFEIK